MILLFTRRLALAALCLAVASCTTLPTGPADLAPLEAALVRPMENLRAGADGGEANAQYAMSILTAYGKRGVKRDTDLAAALRARALAPRGFTSITTYIAGLQGKPGRVAIIQVPRYDLTFTEVGRVDRCVDVLARMRRSRQADAACGGPLARARLEVLWNDGRPPRPGRYREFEA
jgi:hypothetical protein